MSTRQAVWPAELTERRNRAPALESRIRSTATAGSAAADLAALRAELREIACPHWDVVDTEDGQGAWACVQCHDLISPMWVGIADQEQALRRTARQRSAHRANPAAGPPTPERAVVESGGPARSGDRPDLVRGVGTGGSP